MRTIRILHTGDVHLGARFTFLGEKGGGHRRQLLSTFSRTVDLALAQQVDYFLICGDLFDSNQPPRSSLEGAVEELERLGAAGTEVLLVPGTHDRLGKGCVYEDEIWGGLNRVHIFREEGWGEVFFPADRIVFHGWGYRGKHQGDVLEELRPSRETEGLRRVALLHGTFSDPGFPVEDEVTFSRPSLVTSGLDYLALGHWHSFRDLSTDEVGCAYCGSPEALYPGQESGKVVVVTLGPQGREIKPISMGKRSFSRLEVDLQGVADEGALRRLIREQADMEKYLEVVLKGVCAWELPPDPRGLEEEMAHLFLGIRVRDESLPASTGPSPRIAGGIVTGEFFRIASEEMAGAEGERRRICEEALRLGLAYLEGRKS